MGYFQKHPLTAGPYRVIRKAPINVNAENRHLFEKEVERSFNAPNAYEIHNCYLNGEGLVFQNGQIVEESLRHIRAKKPSKFQKLKHTLGALRFTSKRKQTIAEPCMWITDTWSLGYFHWMLDVLPLLLFLKEAFSDHTLLLPSEFQHLGFVDESLKVLNIQPRYIYQQDLIHCEQLIISDMLAPSGNYYPESIELLRSRFASKFFNSEIVPSDRIYISRSKASRRNLINENEFTEMLINHRVQIIHAENYSWMEQAIIMSRCRLLIGVHGAGLSNMLFMPSGSKICEIRGQDDARNNCYFSLASTCGLDYYSHFGEISEKSNDHIGDIKISETTIEEIDSFLTYNSQSK